MNKEIDVLALAKQGLLSASHRLDSSDKQLRLLAKEEVDKILGLIELYASPQPVAFHRASFLSGYEAAQSDANFCDVPPRGWLCTRQAGHDGPCAAIADDKGRELVNRAMLRLAEQEAAQQPVKQEPVCSVCCKYHDKENPVGYFLPPANELDSWEQLAACDDQDAVPLYAAPVRTKDLTDDEIAQAVGSPLDEVYLADFRAVIAADREKNK